MKPIIVSFIFSFLFQLNAKSQDSLAQKKTDKHYPVYAGKLLLSTGQPMSVHLMAIKDSSLFIYIKKSAKLDPFHKINIHADSSWDKYNYKIIKSVKVYNKTAKGWLIGGLAVTGIVVGAIIGTNGTSGSGYSLYGGILGGLLGGGIGAVTGVVVSNADKKYLINGIGKVLRNEIFEILAIEEICDLRKFTLMCYTKNCSFKFKITDKKTIFRLVFPQFRF